VSMFDRPAPPGDRFVNEQNVGNLLVIEVLETVYNVQTENGAADCIRANVHVIVPPGSIGASYMGTLIFGKVLFSRLSQSVGRTVLGVLTGQPGVKVAGKNIPYDLDDPNEAMEQAAVRAMTSRPAPQPQQAADPWAAQQAPPGWGAQPATPAAAPWQAAQQPPAAGPWGQPPAQPAPAQAPPGWGPPPVAPQQGPPPGWGQANGQQPQQGQIPLPPEPEAPPWEQQPAAAPWGGQQ
jgi:hypothetical protein